MRKRLFSILQYIIFMGGGIFLVWWQLRNMTLEERKEFYNAFHNANYWLIIPIVIIAIGKSLGFTLSPPRYLKSPMFEVLSLF